MEPDAIGSHREQRPGQPHRNEPVSKRLFRSYSCDVSGAVAKHTHVSENALLMPQQKCALLIDAGYWVHALDRSGGII